MDQVAAVQYYAADDGIDEDGERYNFPDRVIITMTSTHVERLEGFDGVMNNLLEAIVIKIIFTYLY
jgi:hypothetical protein